MPSHRRGTVSLLLVVVPVLFVWHAELVLVYPANEPTLTNGFVDFDGGTVYHALMYALFVVNFVAASWLLRADPDRDRSGDASGPAIDEGRPARPPLEASGAPAGATGVLPEPHERAANGDHERAGRRGGDRGRRSHAGRGPGPLGGRPGGRPPRRARGRAGQLRGDRDPGAGP